MKAFKWMWNPQYLAQVSHVLAGNLVLLLVWLFWESVPICWLAFGLGMSLAALKEFWFDMRFETPKDTFWDAAMDFSFYFLGGAVGLSLSYWAASR